MMHIDEQMSDQQSLRLTIKRLTSVKAAAEKALTEVTSQLVYARMQYSQYKSDCEHVPGYCLGTNHYVCLYCDEPVPKTDNLQQSDQAEHT